MAEGYVKIDRGIQEHWLWNEKPFDKKSAWIDLLLLARWKDGKDFHREQIHERKRGEVNCSMLWLAERWGWSRNRVKRFLTLLENDNMVSVKASTHDTTITIENYSKFQDVRATGETTGEATGGATGETTGEATGGAYKKKEKKVKKVKKGNNNNPPKSPLDEIVKQAPAELQESIREYIEHRRQIKAPLTELALKKALTELNKLAGGDTQKCIAIIDQSIANGWKGFWELREPKGKKKKNEVREMIERGVFRND